MKLIGCGRKHLAPLRSDAPDPSEGATTTLCGCTITRVANWTRINALEGDECPRCADLTFRVKEPALPVAQRGALA